MLAGGVVHRQVDDEPDVRACSASTKAVEVVVDPEQRVDPVVVGDVVAVVLLRRDVEGRHPDRVHAESREVVDLAEQTPQVAHAVTVGIGEGAQVNLVDHATAPPLAAHDTSVAGRSANNGARAGQASARA